MSIRIKRITFRNFKLFDDFTAEFNDTDLVVFDGPNGFGKTSFYDGIELLLTGHLRRYENLVKIAVDRRYAVDGSPLLNDQSPSGDLILKCELDVDGKSIFLMRRGKRKLLAEAKSFEQINIQLYSSNQYDTETFSIVEDEKNFLTNILGEDYRQNFEFLNYIEQDENLYLLKRKDKDRKDAISHLFNTSSCDERISKLDAISRNIGVLCNPKAKYSLESQKKILEKYQEKFSGKPDNVQHFRLIPWKEIVWDQERIEFSDEDYVKWLEKEGELANLEVFIDNIDDFKKNIKNQQYDKILKDKHLVNQFLLCWNFIENADGFSKNLSLNEHIKEYNNTFEHGALKGILSGKYELSQNAQDLIKALFDLETYKTSIAKILKVNQRASVISQLLVGVKDARQSFIGKFTKLEAESGQKSNCPLCGYSWKDAEELRTNFDDQAEKLELLISESGTELNNLVEEFTKTFLKPITEFFEGYITKNPVDVAFVTKLNEAANNLSNLEMLAKQFEELEINFKRFLNDKAVVSAKIDWEGIQGEVDKKKYKIDAEKIRPYFSSMFLRIFDQNYSYIATIEKSGIVNKRKYIEWQYALHQSTVIKKQKKEFEEQTALYDRAKIIKKKIDGLKGKYNSALKSYQKSLIENIEILFHIYSGRITQENKGSLGLFIGADKNGIRFLENHSRKHDAIFTMSSGQLAALVISFTLALNKRYSRNKLLFIDDPIQTLDELNIAGMVELLRNEFQGRQMFISTHEDMMSAFMRYKFEKFGLKTQRINFRENHLSYS
jgi:exonuclease SbcC